MELLRESLADRIDLTKQKMLAGLAAASVVLGMTGCSLGTQTITVPKDARDLGGKQDPLFGDNSHSFAFPKADSADAYKVDCGDVGGKSFEYKPNGDIVVTCSTSYDQEIVVK